MFFGGDGERAREMRERGITKGGGEGKEERGRKGGEGKDERGNGGEESYSQWK